MRLTVDRTVSFTVLARARTVADHHEDLGCSIQGPVSRAIRQAHAPLKEAIRTLGAKESLRQAQALIRWLEDTPRYLALCTGKRRILGRRRLREDVLFPKPSRFAPRFLHVRSGELGTDVPIANATQWGELHTLLAALSAGATRAELRGLRQSAVCDALLERLEEARWLVPHRGAVHPPTPGITFIGHNTVLFDSGHTRVLVDPYFRPASPLDLPSYQPLQARDLGQVDAVVITHSHGDHFHLGSLLGLPRDVRIFVPHVTRESVFSSDCARRLREAGFAHVEPLRWNETRTLGDVSIDALPFYGEQPTDGEGPYPGLFNEGNTWALRCPSFSAAFFADAGHDVRGKMDSVCTEQRRRHGDTDFLFCGVRGFRLRPLFFGATTLESFLVNVPADALTRSVQLMAAPVQALRYGEKLGARFVVPCADGGAPWYWREGMGPRYPGYPGVPVEGASRLDENPEADPFPERLEEEHVRRGGKSPRALVMRPGEALDLRGNKRPAPAALPGFAWPFGTRN